MKRQHLLGACLLALHQPHSPASTAAVAFTAAAVTTRNAPTTMREMSAVLSTTGRSVYHHHHRPRYDDKNPIAYFYSTSSLVSMNAKPKRGSIVDTYQTVSVNCSKCGQKLFRYKKKNGTKSNLVKCYVERIAEDSSGILEKQQESGISQQDYKDWSCPKCQTTFARSATVKGLPALKLVGGKIRMTKK
mmetsp:Transcript_48568/g.117484  ORF Transcript_48568/g.117484 Transcript_48568/m.117484 type:complete len:189 (-) Transcript_48568:451-1017(-)